MDQQRRPLDAKKMAALWRLRAFPPESPPPLAGTDDVYPVHMLDDTKTLRDIVVTWTLRFNDVLNVDSLHASLSKLLEIGDWRKLGGRLRLKVSLLFIGDESIAADPLVEWRAGDPCPPALHGGTSCCVLHPPSPSRKHRRPSTGKDPSQSYRGAIHPPRASGISSICGSGRCAGDARRLHLQGHALAVASHNFIQRCDARGSFMAAHTYGCHGSAGPPSCLVSCASWPGVGSAAHARSTRGRRVCSGR